MTVPSAALIVLDGWGLAPPGPGNAVELAETPVFDKLLAEYPDATLRTSGRDVGLPDGQMGNSEVGHLNLGAGAIVNQDLTRIDRNIKGISIPPEIIRDIQKAPDKVKECVRIASEIAPEARAGGPEPPPIVVRSFINVVIETRHPSPTSPTRSTSGTRTSVR